MAMSTTEKQKLRVSARFLGPVFSLDHELSDRDQNLIFARNGTGKSFLSRALRYLDQHGQKESIEDAPKNLVSDESADGKGEFTISRGAVALGGLRLDQHTNTVLASASDTIFHVFSEDFVHEELRQRGYAPNGEIDNTIALDSEIIKTKDAEEALKNAISDESEAAKKLNDAFDSSKDAELVAKARINRRLGEFRALELESYLPDTVTKPNTSSIMLSEIIQGLDAIKSLPADPQYPEVLSVMFVDDIDLGAITNSLEKETSPSSVSEEVKARIDAHREFYEKGVHLLGQVGNEKCPFCDQGVSSGDPKAVIDTYVQYFEAEEQKHKAELRKFWKALQEKESQVQRFSPKFATQKTRYDPLKRLIPSKKDTDLALGEQEITDACAALSDWKNIIESKAKSLSRNTEVPASDIKKCLEEVNRVIEENNTLIRELSTAIQRSDDERKKLQRDVCSAFSVGFARDNWANIEALRSLRTTVRERQAALSELAKDAPKTDGRERVAETFEMLLKSFFGDKYLFDKVNFVLRRGNHEMVRGPSRTLSDGEKTAIAFCYFIACAHRKVKSVTDYQRLFLVFDDPVTSMSYDYIYTIAQTLKNLSISTTGDISVNAGIIDGNSRPRPRLLILTHSSYFFNICFSNRIIKAEAAFSLQRHDEMHHLKSFKRYIAPFQDQLRDIISVSEGQDPDHTTANAIRSVLEAVGRFCRPDKPELTDFISFVAAEDGIELKSTLINSFSHGTFYDEVPSDEDILQACKDTLNVVEKYAFGQIAIIRKDT
jgi:wobble nucleotide-excising tRNase